MAKLFSRREKRMKKRLFASVGLSLLALNVFGSAAHATENTERLQSEFIKDQVNSDVGISFESGPLKIGYASNILFPKQPIPNQNVLVSAFAGNHYVEVLDQRGTRQGWSLGAALSPIVGENGNELRGASLIFENLGIASNYTYDKENPAVVPNKRINLPQGGDFQTVMVARKGSGDATTRLMLSDQSKDFKSRTGNVLTKDIGLLIKGATAEPQSYKAQLTWMLTNAPA